MVEPPSDPDKGEPQGGPASDTQRLGKTMIIGTWVVLLGLLTWFAHIWYQRAENPNRTVYVGEVSGQRFVQLKANRSGHYVATGSINGVEVVFLLDTGATSVSVPQGVASKIGLQPGLSFPVITANGTASVFSTQISTVGLGVFERQNVQGHINPHMSGDQVLLGMSFLRHFDLSTSDGTLTISVPDS